jgi:pimeloyl-ACP methyl ester carboxylesterase
MTRTISLAGTTLELIERGQGRSLLFLHAGEGLAPERPWLDLLAKRYRVIAPSHPGYGNSPLIDGGAGGVDDLAYLYLDLAAELGLEDAVLVGADLGGWIAAEMMVRSTARNSRRAWSDSGGPLKRVSPRSSATWRNGSMNTARTIRRRGSRFWKPPSTGISPRKPTRPPISLAPPLL